MFSPGWMKYLLISFLLLISSCKDSAPTDAPIITTKITGVITNKTTGSAVAGVQVTTTPTTSTITTDANGKYDFDDISAGSYVIQAVKSGYNNTQINVNVVEGSTAKADMQIEEISAQLEVTPTFVDFGTDNSQAVLMINNKTGVGTINYTISKNAGWLTLSQSAGSITTDVKNITLSVDRSKVSYGSFNDAITITSNVGTAIVNVQMVKQNPNAPQLTATPIQLDFGTSQSELSVTLSNTGSGDINWNAATSDGWMSVVPASGTITTGSITVKIKANRSGLQANSLNGAVAFTSNGGNQTVGVKMTIPATPILSINPSSLDYGETETSKAMQISNIGTGALNWSIVSNQSWLTVNPTQGSNFSTVTVSINRTAMSKGDYSGLLSISSNGGNDQLTVNMKVPPPAPPAAVTLGSPSGATANSCKLAWSQSSASDFESYKIYMDTNPDVTENSTLVTTITNINTTNYQVTGLSGNTKYYFRIYVVNAKGSSAGSNIVNTTTEKQLGAWAVAITLSGINPTANCLFSLSETNVWAVGDEIWHWNGSTWAKDLKPSGIGKLNAVYFSSSNEGWAVGENSTVIHYDGNVWTKITSSVFPSGIIFYDVVLSGGSDVWICSGNTFYHYDGKVWSKSTISEGYVHDMDLYNGNSIWAAGLNIWRYNGVGWSTTYSISHSAFAISAIDENNIWFVTGYRVYKYDGASFVADTYFDDDSFNVVCGAIDMIATNDGWVGGCYGFYHYDGTTWKSVKNPTSGAISCIKMTSSKTGWAVSSKGEILRYKE